MPILGKGASMMARKSTWFAGLDNDGEQISSIGAIVMQRSDNTY